MHDIRERQIIHDRLQADVDQFLARGGKIEQLTPDTHASTKRDDDLVDLPLGDDE